MIESVLIVFLLAAAAAVAALVVLIHRTRSRFTEEETGAELRQQRHSTRYLERKLEEQFKLIAKCKASFLHSSDSDIGAVNWFLDNYYLIEEKYNEAEKALEDLDHMTLPVYVEGEEKGLPRVFGAVKEILAAMDYRLDEAALIEQMALYQQQQMFSSQEICAVSLMMKIALMERIGTLALKVARLIKEIGRANALLTHFTTEELERNLGTYPGGQVPSTFLTYLLMQAENVPDKSEALYEAVDSFLESFDLDPENLIRAETEKQTRYEVLMGNYITSLRVSDDLEWGDIFRRTSVVEQLLMEDEIYAQMDEKSKAYYRSKIEKLAMKKRTTEYRVVKNLRKNMQEGTQGETRSHIGFALFQEAAKETDRKTKWFQVYFYSISILIFFGFMFVFLSSHRDWRAFLTCVFFFFIPLSELAVQMVNYVIMKFQKPAFLPRLDGSSPLVRQTRALVIIPTLVTGEKSLEDLMEKLEVQYAANPDTNLDYALLADFQDAPEEEQPEDARILAAAQKRLQELSEKYGSRFHFFYRDRVFSKKQNRWIGWDRKRGAILELVRYLKGDQETHLHELGSAAQCPKYIITLDADTQMTYHLPQDLLGAMLHPFHQPVIENGAVVKGYGLMTARIGVNLMDANRSLYSKIFAGQGGIEPYASDASELYQDLFGEASFAGKGIFDVDAYYQVLSHAFPEDLILSHDLLEGSYLRTGFVGDKEFIDGAPSKYLSHTGRLHRWTRGDWQIARWLFSKVRNDRGEKVPNPISGLARWKVFDNLRRSLVTPMVLVLAMLGLWGNLAAALVAGAVLFLPFAFFILDLFVYKKFRNFGQRFYADIFFGLKSILYQILFRILVLPYDAKVLFTGAVTGFIRGNITGKKTLEWVTAADYDKKVKNGPAALYQKMWINPVLGLLVLIRPHVFTLLIGLCWMLGPYLAYLCSKDQVHAQRKLTERDEVFLYRVARRTYLYFEEQMTGRTHFLPPDNFQESPFKGSADRTSPTNIGFGLLSHICARDLGFISLGRMLNRLERTLVSVEQLPKWHGHLYNWYDITNLELLKPLYVSTVDSGNFVGDLIAIKEALIELKDQPIFPKALFFGFHATLDTMGTVFTRELKLFTPNRWKNYLRAFLKGGRSNSRAVECYVEDQLADYREYFCWQSLLFDKKEIEAIGPAAWRTAQKLAPYFQGCITLEQVGKLADQLPHWLARAAEKKALEKGELTDNLYLEKLKEAVRHASQKAGETMELAQMLVKRLEAIIAATDFSVLFDEKKQLFTIGCDTVENKNNQSHYDLMASEARQTSYLAVASHQVDYKHWQTLGRGLVQFADHKGLVSWTGTMFEYYMPLLLLENYEYSLMNETYLVVLDAQRDFARRNHVPWGISESGYGRLDLDYNYQYKAFGIPDLALKRQAEPEVVVAPYASALGLMIKPKAALVNLRELQGQGYYGKYGFYEAVDYTSKKYENQEGGTVVRSYMAHHQGMSLAAMDNILNNMCLQRRFHQDIQMKAGKLLLQEKIPTDAMVMKDKTDTKPDVLKFRRQAGKTAAQPPVSRSAALLTGQKTALLLTKSGAGFTKMDGCFLGRWRPYEAHPQNGLFFYVQDVQSGKWWSAGSAPSCVKPERYRASLLDERAEFVRLDDKIETKTEVFVSAGNGCEIRVLSLTNEDSVPRSLEITSYLEIILNELKADLAHRAFSNLFVKTEAAERGLLASRKGRNGRVERWAYQTLLSRQEEEISWETDRMRFIGRGRSVKDPQAVALRKQLSNFTGAVLDPIFSLRTKITLQPRESRQLAWVTGMEDSRERAEEMQRNVSWSFVEEERKKSAVRSRIEKQICAVTERQEQLAYELLEQFTLGSKQQPFHQISGGVARQSDLWKFGISGDLPMVLVLVKSIYQKQRIWNLLKAQEYLRLKHIAFDLVFLVCEKDNYHAPIQQMLQGLTAKCGARLGSNIFVIRDQELAQEERQCLHWAAQVVLEDKAPVSKQLERMRPDPEKTQELPRLPEKYRESTLSNASLLFFNGYGGFGANGDEYVIGAHKKTPLPWVNIIANPHFGTMVSEAGGGYTWSGNSRENQITAWSNDAVVDPAAESITLTNVKTKQRYHPCRPQGTTAVVRHGFGYSVFESEDADLKIKLTIWCGEDEPVKYSLLELKGKRAEPIELDLAYGVNFFDSQNKINCEPKRALAFQDNRIYYRNLLNGDFPEDVFFMELGMPVYSHRLSPPELKARLVLADQEQVTVPCLLGKSGSAPGRSAEDAQQSLQMVKRGWRNVLKKITVSTPDPSMDVLLNGWLLYQDLSCRIYGRTAFYQCGGAYGFRDQLQDSLALLYTAPSAARNQILKHAAKQFPEGDVLHWWHEAGEGQPIRGIRTTFSDDLLWLVYAANQYVKATGDKAIWEEEIPYLEGEALEGETEKYIEVQQSQEQSSLLEHCMRAVDRSKKLGSHGVPLIGCGDWNDGFSAVGVEGKGESVWMGWFLIAILKEFAPACPKEKQEEYTRYCKELIANLNETCWEADRYLRAYYDDGTKMGSPDSDECRIDALSQSWAVLSGGAPRERAEKAMETLEKYLVDREHGLIQLLDPPFDQGEKNPGYIKGYLPGVRENGGQYTHAAVWAVMAFAHLGQGDRAWELFHMINPINHTLTESQVKTYQTEPYVMAADVYTARQQEGRGGWSWYTGAAGWMYQAGLRSILGFEMEAGKIRISPCVPAGWDRYELEYRHGGSLYKFMVENPEHVNSGVIKVAVDGVCAADQTVALTDDGGIHYVTVVMG